MPVTFNYSDVAENCGLTMWKCRYAADKYCNNH